MKTPRIANAIGHIDDDLVSGAAESKKKKKNFWVRWGSLAAGFAVLIIAGAAILPSLLGGDDTAPGKYQYHISGTEGDVEWPWEYKTVYEKYTAVKFNGKEYLTRARAIPANLLGDVLGTCEAEGVDSYTDEKHTETFEVRKIHGVSEDRLIAIGAKGEFYVYMNDDNIRPATFGELLDAYGLAQNLEFSRFAKYEGFDEKGSFTVNDDSYIWQILSECRDAELLEDSEAWERNGRSYLSFTATSEALGMYKKVVYITEDGYIWTNIFNVAHIYFMGEDAAGKIIGYADSNSVAAETEVYEYTVSGTLTEIGDGYVLIDDTILCANEADGTVYKVFADDLRMKRCMDCLNIEIGDTVVVKYQGTISHRNEISGAYSMYQGTLVEGDLAIPE